MKKLITILLLLIAIEITAKDYQIGYLVVTSKDSGHGCVVKRTLDINVVEKLLNSTFSDLQINLQYELTYSRFIEVESEKMYFYVEVRKINKNGKYRRIKNRYL